MKRQRIRRISLVLAALIVVLCRSQTAFATNVYISPSVDLGPKIGPGAHTEEQAPGESAPAEETLAPETAQEAGETAQIPAPGAEESPAEGGTVWLPVDYSEPSDAIAPESPGAGTEAVPGAEEAAAMSIASPNTLIASGTANIYYLNGRTIDITKPSIALTYDDGPYASVGNRIMDVMALYGAKCTFFMVGNRVSSYTSEVQRMAAEGHETANHTYAHVYLDKVGASDIQYQVSAANQAIASATGQTPALMRLPGGRKNSTVLANISMPIILWNVDTRDWESRDTNTTISRVIGQVKDGDIVLMHELYNSTAAATETIVPTLVGQGFQLVTVSELAAIKGVPLVNGQVYYSF